MNITVTVVNAFPKGAEGGNPAGIVLDLEGSLPTAARQAVAAKMGLSETAFISKPKGPGADYRVEFFTPNRQIAHCGHATIAAFSYLAQKHGVQGALVKETIETPRKVLLDGPKASMEQLAPRYERVAVSLQKALGVVPVMSEIVSTGNRFLFAQVRDLNALQPNLEEIGRISEELDLIGFYAFTTGGEGVDAFARMFAPRYGIAEESATGMAAGPLACLLHDRFGLAQTRFMIGQGDHMPEPSPSRIEVNLTLDGEKIAKVTVGGTGRIVSQVVVNEEDLCSARC